MCSVSACQFRMCKCLREAPKKHDSKNAETVAEDCAAFQHLGFVQLS